MNRDFVLFNLREAYEALGQMINEIQSEPDYEYGEYVVDMRHLYDHVNTAWNARNADPERAERCSDKDFFEWRQFPKDIDMSV